jgi:hypothetical protein
MEGSREAGQSGLELKSRDPDVKGNGKESTTTAKPNPRTTSPHLHTERKHSSPHSSQKSLPRASSRSPARSTHSTSTPNEKEKEKISKGGKQQAEGTQRLVEWVDEDGISHWHHARQEHVNLHTECGRHGDEWLFGGWSLMGVWRGLMGRR